jgi:hypothetical protein
MLTLGYFTKFPAIYKEREKLVPTVDLKNISVSQDEDKIIVTSNTGNYEQTIEIYDKTINLKSPVKVACTCESFKYEFAYSIYKDGSLIGALHFFRSIIQRPKEKNKYNIASGCKHLIALSRQCLKIKLK